MKVKVISAIFATGVLFTSAAYASFTTSPDGSFGTTLNFSGTIVDTNPDWAYQLDPSAEALAKDWETTQNSGLVQSDGTLLFDFSSKGDIPFVQGYIESAASQGGVGLSPVVTITTSNGDIEVVGPNMPQGGITDVVLDVTEGTDGDQVATLQMQVSGVTAGAVMYNNAYYWNEGASGFGTAQTAAAKALELLKTSPDFANIYQGKTNSAADSKILTPGVEGAWTIYDSSNVGYGLTRTDYKNVIGAFATTISSVKLVTDADDIPEVWNAVLPVSIVVQ